MELKTHEQLKRELSAPLPSEAVKPHPTKTYLSSIKAIYVTERLNDVFGIGRWQIRTQEIERGEKGMVVVKAILTVPQYDVYYESYGGNDNGGETSKNFDLGDAYKGATTDAITKIGSYLEIGIDVFKGKTSAPKAYNTPPPPPAAKPNPIIHPILVKGTEKWNTIVEGFANKLPDCTWANIRLKNTVSPEQEKELNDAVKLLQAERLKTPA